MIHKTQLTITLTSRTALLALLMTLILSAPLDLVSETMTMTTTYPSPVGIYRTMVTTSNTDLARDVPGAAVTVGKTRGANLSVNGNISALGTGNISAGGAISGASAAIGSGGMTVNGSFQVKTSNAPQEAGDVLTAAGTDGTAVWKPATGGGAAPIVCHHTNTDGSYCLTFSASDCSGNQLPSPDYVGTAKHFTAGTAIYTFYVLDNGESFGSCTGPGAYGYMADASAGRLDVHAVYFKKTGAGGGAGTGGPGTGGSGLVSGRLYGFCHVIAAQGWGRQSCNATAPAGCSGTDPITQSSTGDCRCPSQYTLIKTADDGGGDYSSVCQAN